MYGQSRREEGGDFELENPKIWVLIDGPVTPCSLGSKSNQNHQFTGFSGIKSREVELKTPRTWPKFGVSVGKTVVKKEI